jgi:low affinity Fe/Cu permease
MQLNKWFTHIAEAVSRATGHAVAFIICCVIVIIWAATGPVFGFSDTWQLIINTGTTIVTFLMVPHSKHPKPGWGSDPSKA